jgi:predicted  nucleic acid-binding Zn-ribbon protein
MTNIQTLTKKELENKKSELETEFNKVRDELGDFIKSCESVIDEKMNWDDLSDFIKSTVEASKVSIDEMSRLSKEWAEINSEIDKRNGKSVR